MTLLAETPTPAHRIEIPRSLMEELHGWWSHLHTYEHIGRMFGVGCLDVAVALDSEHREESAKPVKVSEPALELLFSCLWSAAQLKPPQIGTHSTASIAPEQ
jgi:hypothetical protein